MDDVFDKEIDYLVRFYLCVHRSSMCFSRKPSSSKILSSFPFLPHILSSFSHFKPRRKRRKLGNQTAIRSVIFSSSISGIILHPNTVNNSSGICYRKSTISRHPIPRPLFSSTPLPISSPLHFFSIALLSFFPSSASL